MSEDIEQILRQAFEENLEELRRNSGHAISPDLKETAWQQVLMYWKKMRHVAESITETEVRLHLPNQVTDNGRRFAIEGVVDIVSANNQVVMYDIKTHDAVYIREHPEEYEKQLNVYAYIWKQLRRQQLNKSCIIATAIPDNVRDAIRKGNSDTIQRALETWDPLIELPFDSGHVDAMIADFKRVVDNIEDSKFTPVPLERLLEPIGADKRLFATEVCRFCDARFSCSSYRLYAYSAGGRVEATFRTYYSDLGSDTDREEWTTNTLDAAPDSSTLADIL
jgi:hypothetical protein